MKNLEIKPHARAEATKELDRLIDLVVPLRDTLKSNSLSNESKLTVELSIESLI